MQSLIATDLGCFNKIQDVYIYIYAYIYEQMFAYVSLNGLGIICSHTYASIVFISAATDVVISSLFLH